MPAGATSVRAETGAASLTIEVPNRVAARIGTRVVLGSVQIDESRFPPVAGGYESPDYASAANRVDVDVQGGVGSCESGRPVDAAPQRVASATLTPSFHGRSREAGVPVQ